MCRVEIFWKINKRAGWKFSGKSIILQVILIFAVLVVYFHYFDSVLLYCYICSVLLFFSSYYNMFVELLNPFYEFYNLLAVDHCSVLVRWVGLFVGLLEFYYHFGIWQLSFEFLCFVVENY